MSSRGSAVEAMTNSTGNCPPPGRPRPGDHADAGNIADLSEHLTEYLLGVSLPLAPGLGHHAGEPARRIGALEGVLRLRQRFKHVVHFFGVTGGLLHG